MTLSSQNSVSIQAPASKSVSHRAVIAAALAKGQSRLTNVLESDDLVRTKNCLAVCGADFETTDKALFVTGVNGKPQGGEQTPADFYMHESGTSCRLLTGVAAAGSGLFRIHGVPRLHERPIGALTTVLAAQGVQFQFEGNTGYPPFIMNTKGLRGGEMAVDLEESSQYLSGLLLAAACASNKTTLFITGKKAVSWPYVALTLSVMRDFGIEFSVQKGFKNFWNPVNWEKITAPAPEKIRFVVYPGTYKNGVYAVEGDWSNASYFLAAGAVGPQAVTITGLRQDSLQGDKAMLEFLKKMGANVHWHNNQVLHVAPNPQGLLGITADMSNCPDIVPTLATVAAFATTSTTITGASHLRIKECDRLEATVKTLQKAGATVRILKDGLHITPQKLLPKVLPVTTYGDHRMAMSAAIFTLAKMQVECDDPGCVAKSFPDFWQHWKKVTGR